NASCSARSSARRARSASVAVVSNPRSAGRSPASWRSSSRSVNRRSAIAHLSLGRVAEPRGALLHVVLEPPEDLADGLARQVERRRDRVLRVAVEVMEDRHGQLLLGQPSRELREIVQVVDPARLVAEITGADLRIELF